MKKVISILLVLIISLSLVSCVAEKTNIEDCEWKMRAVMSSAVVADDSDTFVVAVGESDEIYPDAVVAEVLLNASDGILIITDITNNKIYTGTYKMTKSTPKSINYEIEIEGQQGCATVAQTKYYTGEEIPTLPINLGEYSIYFIPNK